MKQSPIRLMVVLLALNLFGCSPTVRSPEAPVSSNAPRSSLTEAIRIHDAFIAFLDARSVEKYLELNGVIADNDEYLRSNCSLIKIELLLEKKEFDRVIAKVDGPDCLAFISTPRYHMLLAAAHRAKGETTTANSRASVGFLLADTILKSGDGTLEKPFHVPSVEAEYDVLRMRLKKKRISQSAFKDNGREIDALRLSSGETLYFDTTLHRKMLLKELNEKAPR